MGLIWGIDAKLVGQNQSPYITHSTNYFDVPKNELSGGDTFILKIIEVYQLIFEEMDKNNFNYIFNNFLFYFIF